MKKLKLPLSNKFKNDLIHENQGYSKPFSYDGNQNENYTLLSNDNPVCELQCGEDDAIELVDQLNQMVKLNQ
jgi:hypothetical protein